MKMRQLKLFDKKFAVTAMCPFTMMVRVDAENELDAVLAAGIELALRCPSLLAEKSTIKTVISVIEVD